MLTFTLEAARAGLRRRRRSQRVPNAIAYPGYKVSCSGGGSDGAVIEYCDDYPMCSSCPVKQPVVNAGACVPNDPIKFGSAGATVQCPAKGSGDILVPEATNLRPGAVEINWFEDPGCGSAGGANTFFRTVVSVPYPPRRPARASLARAAAPCRRSTRARPRASQALSHGAVPFHFPARLLPPPSQVVADAGVCQFVPSSPGAEGYRVFCNADGTGVYQTCIDRSCARCVTAAPFASEQCLANPAVSA